MAARTLCHTKLLLWAKLVIGSFKYITSKRCITHEPEMDWFKLQLSDHKFWVLQPSRNEGWAHVVLPCPFIEDEEELEEWMMKTYPGVTPFDHSDAHQEVDV